MVRTLHRFTSTVPGIRPSHRDLNLRKYYSETAGRCLRPKLADALDSSHHPQLIACIFGFVEILRTLTSRKQLDARLLNRKLLCPLEIATRYGQVAVIEFLIAEAGAQLTERAISIAAQDEKRGSELMEVLLHHSSPVEITPQILHILDNENRSPELTEILLRRSGPIERASQILQIIDSEHCAPRAHGSAATL